MNKIKEDPFTLIYAVKYILSLSDIIKFEIKVLVFQFWSHFDLFSASVVETPACKYRDIFKRPVWLFLVSNLSS
jgi:hypothetical protein